MTEIDTQKLFGDLTLATYEDFEQEMPCDIWRCPMCSELILTNQVSPSYCTYCGADLRRPLEQAAHEFAEKLRVIGRTGIGPGCINCEKIKSKNVNEVRDICEVCLHQKLRDAADAIDLLLEEMKK